MNDILEFARQLNEAQAVRFGVAVPRHFTNRELQDAADALVAAEEMNKRLFERVQPKESR